MRPSTSQRCKPAHSETSIHEQHRYNACFCTLLVQRQIKKPNLTVKASWDRNMRFTAVFAFHIDAYPEITDYKKRQNSTLSFSADSSSFHQARWLPCTIRFSSCRSFWRSGRRLTGILAWRTWMFRTAQRIILIRTWSSFRLPVSWKKLRAIKGGPLQEMVPIDMASPLLLMNFFEGEAAILAAW